MLDELKALARQMGYRFEVEADGTERMIRADGSVAVTARPPSVTRLRRRRAALGQCVECAAELTPDDREHQHVRCQPCRIYQAALQQRRRKL